jgi:hypothetical protein
MEISIHALHVSQSNLLPENHLIKRSNEKRIEEATVEYRQTNHPTNEFEVTQMLGIDSRMWVDLERIIVMSGVFEEAVEWIKHLMR